jgi:putative transposase
MRDEFWHGRGGLDDDSATAAGSSLIDEIVREGARRMLAQALGAEVETYIAQFADERDKQGRRLVMRNGYHQPQEVLSSTGTRAPAKS